MERCEKATLKVTDKGGFRISPSPTRKLALADKYSIQAMIRSGIVSPDMHEVEVEKVVKDTKPENPRRGVVFVRVRHSKTCAKCEAAARAKVEEEAAKFIPGGYHYMIPEWALESMDALQQYKDSFTEAQLAQITTLTAITLSIYNNLKEAEWDMECMERETPWMAEAQKHENYEQCSRLDQQETQYYNERVAIEKEIYQRPKCVEKEDPSLPEGEKWYFFTGRGELQAGHFERCAQYVDGDDLPFSYAHGGEVDSGRVFRPMYNQPEPSREVVAWADAQRREIEALTNRLEEVKEEAKRVEEEKDRLAQPIVEIVNKARDEMLHPVQDRISRLTESYQEARNRLREALQVERPATGA